VKLDVILSGLTLICALFSSSFQLAAAKTVHLPGFNVKKTEEKVEDFEIQQRKKDAEVMSPPKEIS
jgi:hypothetical protein